MTTRTLKVKLQVKGAYKPGRAADRLREAAAGLPAGMRSELGAASLVAMQDVRAEVLTARFPALAGANEVHRPGQRDGRFRAHLASAVDAEPLHVGASGVRIKIVGERVAPSRGHRLAQLSSGQLRWRSPTFGRTENPQDWHTMSPHPWFFEPIRAQRERFESAVGRAMRRAVRTIDREA